jgi:hypothetical protein
MHEDRLFAVGFFWLRLCYFSFWCAVMGLFRWIFVESKSFEFAMEEGVHVLCVFERGRGFMCYVSLGKAFMPWLVAIVEELYAKATKEILNSFREGSKAFTVHRCANKNGCYLVIGEYGGGGWCNSIVMREGQEGKGWYNWVIKL